VLRVFDDASNSKDTKKRQMFFLIAAIATLYASYIWLCGNTHLIKVIRAVYPTMDTLILADKVIMITCAAISFATALVGFKLFPAIVESFQHFELGSDGKIVHAENYLIEAVELVKESILMVSDRNIVLKANEVSKNLFGAKVVGTPIGNYIHPDDAMMFDDAVVRVANSYSFTPATIELRIRQPQRGVDCTPKSQSTTRIIASRRLISDSRVYATDDSAGKNSPGTTPSFRLRNMSSFRGAKRESDEFTWIEITMCKGKQTNDNGGFEYDLKMVCRDIDDRKKRALYQTLMEGTEERGRINESKLRYLSCIAHDLKTPLQSFTYLLDLLSHSDLHEEQREYVEHANVAIDLMKLTISQTMDISKALTGAKLSPRRTTVFISSVLQRVKIIINGYGKSVPVSFEVAPDVCDEIITDEEWLWQMLLNLLTNACKYTDKGSIKVRLSVTAEQLMSDKGATEKYSGLPPLLMNNITPDMLLCEVIDTGEPLPSTFYPSCQDRLILCLCALLAMFFRCGYQPRKDSTHFQRLRTSPGGPSNWHGPGAVRCAHACRGPARHLRRAAQLRVCHRHRHRAVVRHPLPPRCDLLVVYREPRATHPGKTVLPARPAR